MRRSCLTAARFSTRFCNQRRGAKKQDKTIHSLKPSMHAKRHKDEDESDSGAEGDVSAAADDYDDDDDGGDAAADDDAAFP